MVTAFRKGSTSQLVGVRQAELSSGVVNAAEVTAQCCPSHRHHWTPHVPGWLLGTGTLAAPGQPSGATRDFHGDGGRDRSAPAPQPPELTAQGPRAAPAGCSMGTILLPPPTTGSCRSVKELPRAPGPSNDAGPGAGGGAALGAKGSVWQGPVLFTQ